MKAQRIFGNIRLVKRRGLTMYEVIENNRKDSLRGWLELHKRGHARVWLFSQYGESLRASMLGDIVSALNHLNGKK